MSDTPCVASHYQEGPDINVLHHRLTDFPEEWMSAELPHYFSAIIHDVVFAHCENIHASELAVFRRPQQQCEWYRMSLLVAYFLADESFDSFTFTSNTLILLLEATAKALAEAGQNNVYINDVDRREEFIRVVLDALGLFPKGENSTVADDRLQAVSSQARLNVLRAAKAAEKRSNDLRVALAKQKARESADKMTRE
ncbi:hypothetical protein [Alkalimarinus alittae]|uniref:Uncharacterized protein n=1 Tax=Alkalimarinus alittae TaxID=2961619 RepID=A0ABY6MY81_9ALTE|nr:hypothetical protein [Alkalimarinus alittae]UZE94798.1 hypothetical protein NKI27_11990 [Alkalimarinus alittae]